MTATQTVCPKCGSDDLSFGVDEHDAEDGTVICEGCDHEWREGDGMPDATLITAEQVATINEARTVLEKVAHNAHIEHDSQASGMLFARASAAANDLFLLLVWASTYGHEPLTKAQLHNEAGDDATQRSAATDGLDR